MTNADKTGCSFTGGEEAGLVRGDIVQVLKSKHVASAEATPTVLILSELCAPLKLPVKCCLCSGRGER